MKNKVKFSRKAKIWTSIASAVCAIVLAIGLPLGLADFSHKNEPKPEQLVQGATAPTNDSYWDEDVSRVDTDWAGSGTKDDPWLITSAAELAGLSYSIQNNTKSEYLINSSYYYLYKYFKQTEDIDVSSYWWRPIGFDYDKNGTFASRYFSAIYDGDGHTVSGIFTKAYTSSDTTDAQRYAKSRQGLFGRLQAISGTTAHIMNLGIRDSKIEGYQYVGGIVGYASSYSRETNCYNKAEVSSYSNAGGIVGYSHATILTNCYNTGFVNTKNNYVGGLVGASSTVQISNSFNTGNVNGNEDVGGLIGNGNPRLFSCYNTGNVVDNYSGAGGIIGYRTSSNNMENCYYGGNCNLSKGVGGGSGSDTTTKIANLNSTNYAKNKDWYTNSSNWSSSAKWDFGNVWEINKNKNGGYPAFKWQKPEPTNDSFWDDDISRVRMTWSGSGTEADPWLINSAEELAGLSYSIYWNKKSAYYSSGTYYAGKYFKQTTDIDVSAYWWRPIGVESSPVSTSFIGRFAGNYNGAGYTISGIFTKKGTDYGSLFGYIFNFGTARSTIQNLGIKDSYVHGAGIVKEAAKCNIINCFNSATVNGSGVNGGIVGELFSTSTISNCYNDGEIISSGRYVGGIVGSADGNITNCYNVGKITGKTGVGGIAGFGLKITNCFNTALITANTQYAGGIVGENEGEEPISNCYNTGKVISPKDAGGIIGHYYDTTVTITNCYYGGACSLVTGVGNKTGGIYRGQTLSGKSEAKNSSWYSSTSQTVGVTTWNSTYPWDFTNVWKIKGSNDGYPVFKWQPDPTWIDFADTNWSGTGTKDDPYIIDSAEKLAGIAKTTNAGTTHVGEYFKQTANIDLSGYEWVPIGYYLNYFDTYDEDDFEEWMPFVGNYDGGNFIIKGMTINSNLEATHDYMDNVNYYAGLFGTVGDSNCNIEIRNVRLLNSQIKVLDNGRVGGLIGDVDCIQLIVENCEVDCDIESKADNAGGVIGFDYNSIIKDVINRGNISGRTRIGGIIGGGAGGEVINCQNYGDITSTTGGSVGGIIGFMYGSSVYKIDKCINDSRVNGSTAGLIVGNSGGDSSNINTTLEINNCIARGTLDASGNYAAGIIGNSGPQAKKISIKNTFVDAVATTQINIFIGQSNSTVITIDSCYGKIGFDKVYSAGTFSDWGLVSGMKDDLPMQRELFFMAGVSTATSADIIAKLNEKGFERV